MLSVAARRLALSTRGASFLRSHRALTTIALDKSHLNAGLSDVTPLDISSLFSDFNDPTIRSQLSKIREMENELIASMSTKGDSVDWKYWEETIQYPGLVAELKKVHESLPMPDIEAQKAVQQKELEDLFNPILAQFSQLAKDADAEAAKLEENIAKYTYLKDNIADLTVDEFLERYPSVKKSLEDDIANNRWFISE